MLINSAQKKPSIQHRFSIEFRDPADQLSANILGSYLWRYLYLPSLSSLIHEHLCSCFIRSPFSLLTSKISHFVKSSIVSTYLWFKVPLKVSLKAHLKVRDGS